MQRLLILAALCALVALVFAPTALAQNATCKQFATQAEAQAALPQNPQLDANKDGIACNDLLRKGEQPASQAAPPDAQQPATPQPTLEQTAAPQPAPQPQAEATGQPMEAGGNLPATGGPSLLLPTAALVLGAGLLAGLRLRRS